MRAILMLLLLRFEPSTPGVHLGHPRHHAAGGREAKHRRGQGQHPQHREHPRPPSSPSSTGILSLRSHEDQAGPNLGKGFSLLPFVASLFSCVLRAHRAKRVRPLASYCSSRRRWDEEAPQNNKLGSSFSSLKPPAAMGFGCVENGHWQPKRRGEESTSPLIFV